MFQFQFQKTVTVTFQIAFLAYGILVFILDRMDPLHGQSLNKINLSWDNALKFSCPEPVAYKVFA